MWPIFLSQHVVNFVFTKHSECLKLPKCNHSLASILGRTGGGDTKIPGGLAWRARARAPRALKTQKTKTSARLFRRTLCEKHPTPSIYTR